MTSEFTEITVIGEDDTGLIAQVTTLLFEHGINIEDLDQAVRDGLFRMSMTVDASGMEPSRAQLRAELDELGEDLGVDVQVRFPSDRETDRIAVLVTRESHCLEALLDAWANDELGAEISVVIGNHDDLEPLAEQHGVPFYDVGDDGGQPDEERLLEILAEYDVDLIVLARYMRILSPKVVFRYEDRIINIHPSLLPSFPGARAYEQAVQEGVRVAGVTAHYVTTDLDQGPIITQRAFDVPPRVDGEGAGIQSQEELRQELKRRGQPLEAKALLEAVNLHLDRAITVHRARTHLRDGIDPDEYQLGLSRAAREATPDRPVDGLGEAVRSESTESD